MKICETNIKDINTFNENTIKTRNIETQEVSEIIITKNVTEFMSDTITDPGRPANTTQGKYQNNKHTRARTNKSDTYTHPFPTIKSKIKKNS